MVKNRTRTRAEAVKDDLNIPLLYNKRMVRAVQSPLTTAVVRMISLVIA